MTMFETSKHVVQTQKFGCLFLDRQRKVRVPSNDDLLRLSAELGAKWKMLASALGTSKARIEAIVDANRRMVNKCYDSLISWKQRNSCGATYEALEDGLCLRSFWTLCFPAGYWYTNGHQKCTFVG